MELKLLLRLSFFLLVVAFYPSSGEPRRSPQRRISIRTTPRPALNTTTRRIIWVPSIPQPTPSVSSIPKGKCGLVLDKLPRYQFKKINKFFPLCLRLNESQLLRLLKDVGGFNPRYVAVNKENACKFTDISQDTIPLPRNFSSPAKPRQFKRMVSLRSGTTLRGCWSRGSFADGTNLRHQCTECAATTQLPADVFPPYINEAICGDADGFCYRRIGRCIQKVIRFTFLRRTGEFERNDDLSSALGVDVYVEEFDTFEQDIRSCCECRLFPF